MLTLTDSLLKLGYITLEAELQRFGLLWAESGLI